MTAPQGWYVDSDNPSHDVYWTGGTWSGASRPTEAGTPRFPDDDDDASWRSAARAPVKGDEWSFRATVMYVLAALAAIGAVVGAVVLISVTARTCVDAGYLDDCTDSRPFVAAGVSVGVGGLAMAFVIFVVGKLCSAQAESSQARS